MLQVKELMKDLKSGNRWKEFLEPKQEVSVAYREPAEVFDNSYLNDYISDQMRRYAETLGQPQRNTWQQQLRAYGQAIGGGINGYGS